MILRTRHVVRSKMIKIYIYIYAVKTVDAFHDQYICLVFFKKNGGDHGKIMGRSWESSSTLTKNICALESIKSSSSGAVRKSKDCRPDRELRVVQKKWYHNSCVDTAFSDILRYSKIFSAFFLCFLFWFDVFVASLKRLTLCYQTPTTAKL